MKLGTLRIKQAAAGFLKGGRRALLVEFCMCRQRTEWMTKALGCFWRCLEAFGMTAEGH